MKDLLNMQKCIDELKQLLPPDAVLTDEPMSRHTTFKIGGPADCFVMPSTVQEAVAVIKTVKTCGVPLTLLGNGSNLLVMDKGIRGVVLNLSERFTKIEAGEAPDTIKVQCGAATTDVSKFAGAKSLTGLEFAVGIPGSIGGCIFMNAGAYDGEMKNVIKSVTAVSPDGEIKHFTNEEADFGYRHSAFQDNGDLILEAELQLSKGDAAQISARMADLTERRESKQPLEMPSAGSTFKRPKGYFAGTLIDQTGLKGLTVGGAQVSKKHAGFVVNIGGATAQDVLDLIAEVQKRVYAAHGVMLYPEVRMIGEQ